MAIVHFYEKPGCQGNARQKDFLIESGHMLVVHDLLKHSFAEDPGVLRSFFGDKPVADWFNPNAPAVKKGLIKPETLDEQQAIALMLAEPILIRRPLMESGGLRVSGFDRDEVQAWLGIAKPQPGVDLEKCPNHAKSCRS